MPANGRVITLGGFGISSKYISIPRIESKISKGGKWEGVGAHIPNTWDSKLAHIGPPSLYFPVIDEKIDSTKMNVVIGCSLDALTSVRYAAREGTKLDGLILVSPFFELENNFLWRVAKNRYVRRVLRALPSFNVYTTPEKPTLEEVGDNGDFAGHAWSSPSDRLEFGAESRKIYTHQILNIVNYTEGAERHFTECLARIKCPILVILTGADTLAEPKLEETFASDLLHRENCEIRIIPGAGHALDDEGKPSKPYVDTAVQYIKKFLGGLGTA